VSSTLEEFRKVNASYPGSSIAEAWKSEGKRVIGWMCNYLPEEIIYAAGMLPIRVTGCDEEGLQLGDAQAYMSNATCSFVQTCFQLALQKRFAYLDGCVSAMPCHSMIRMTELWRLYLPTPFVHTLAIPRAISKESLELFTRDVEEFRQSLGRHFDTEITDESLRNAIAVYNETRSLLKQLYEFRKQEVPPVLGSEIQEVLNACQRMPRDRFNELLFAFLKEVRAMGPDAGPADRKPRLMLSGSIHNNSKFIKLIEDAGAVVVADELCSGTRYWWRDVNTDEPPVNALARRYLNIAPCGRMYPVSNRVNHVTSFIREYRVDGVVSEILQYCTSYQSDQPLLRAELEKQGIPMLDLQVEYGSHGSGQVKTRVEAFIEMLAQGVIE